MIFPLYLVAIGGVVSAQLLARQVPQNITERASRPSGGVGMIPEQFCPNDLLSCSEIFCCPTSLTCYGYFGPGGVCCPEGQDCSTAMQTAPYCADDTWTLWDETRGGINLNGYFCCADGLVGLLGGKCVDPATVSSPTLEAMEMAPGGAPLTSAVATSTNVAISLTGTTIAKTVITTSTSASTATTSVVVVGSGNSTVSVPKSATTKSVSSLSLVASAGGSTAGGSTAATTTSSLSASPSATKSSDGNTYKTFGLGYMGLLQAALAVLVGAVF